MKALGPLMGPGSKMELSQSLEKARFKTNDSSKASGKLDFADLVQDRSPQRPREDLGRDASQARERQQDRANELRPDDRQQDSRPVKVEERVKASKADKPQTSKSDVRKQAMLEFMDSMENEFGITPARMLEAMAKIDPEGLQSQSTITPEDTALQVINNLDLASEDKADAMALYASFISQWRQLQDALPSQQQMPDEALSQQTLLATGGAGVLGTGALGEGMNPEAMSDKTSGAIKLGESWQKIEKPEMLDPQLSAADRRMKLNESLDQLNAKFFGKSEAMPLAKAPDLESQLLAQRALESAKIQEGLTAQADPKNFFQDDSGMYSAKASAFDLSQTLPGMTADMGPKLGEVAMPKLAEAGGISGALAALTAELKGIEASSDQSSDGDLAEGSETDLGELKSDDLSQLGTPQGDFGQILKPQVGATAATAATAAAAPIMVADEKAAIEALQSQSQIMLDKGGGEAKISFNQEGLGQISLKVVVHEGKVNLEMSTDNKEAKHLLESSLSDLKSSLAQQKIAVDQVRVDVGTSGMNDQNKPQMNFGSDMNRDQARQMMQQFRDETAGRRDPFYEMSGIKAYGRKMDGPAPIPAAPDVALKRYAGQGRGDRVNVVA